MTAKVFDPNQHLYSMSMNKEGGGGRENELATLTIKCEAAARPMTLLRRDMGRTSAP